MAGNVLADPFEDEVPTIKKRKGGTVLADPFEDGSVPTLREEGSLTDPYGFDSKFNRQKATPEQRQFNSELEQTRQLHTGQKSLNRGLLDVGEGLKQTYLEGKELVGLEKKGTALDYTRKTQQGRDKFEEVYGDKVGSTYNRVLGNAVPYMAIPNKVPVTGLGRWGLPMLTGAAIGGTQFIPEGGSRTKSTAVGTGFGALVPAGIGLFNKVSKKGAMSVTPEMSAMLDDFEKLQREGAKLPPLMGHQYRPQDMISARIGAQALSTSKAGQERLIQQQVGAVNALDDLAPKSSASTTAIKVHDIAKKAYTAARTKLLHSNPFSTQRQGGSAIHKGISQDFVNKSRTEVTNSYNVADQAASIEKPIFNLSAAQEKTKQIRTAVMGEGKQVVSATESGLPQVTQKSLNVADTPNGQLAGIIDEIDGLAKTQTNYEAVKQLKTRVGNIIENNPWDANFNRGQAKKLYGILSDTLKSPVNNAPQYVRSITAATAKARARFDVMDQPTIRGIIQSDNPATLANQFGVAGGLTDEVMTTMQKYSAKRLPAFRAAVQQKIITSEGGARKAIEGWLKGDPEGFAFVVPKSQQKKFIQLADDLDTLAASNLGQIGKLQIAAKDTVKQILLNNVSSKADYQKLLSQYGGQGSKGHDLLRGGIFEDIIERSMSYSDNGLPSVNHKALSQAIREYEKAGVWESILNKQDKIKLKGLEAYSKLIFGAQKDAGVSLQAAQAITNLKHPSTFIAGVHQLSVNSIMARALMSKGVVRAMSGARKGVQLSPKGVPLLVDSLLEGVDVTPEKLTIP